MTEGKAAYYYAGIAAEIARVLSVRAFYIKVIEPAWDSYHADIGAARDAHDTAIETARENSAKGGRLRQAIAYAE